MGSEQPKGPIFVVGVMGSGTTLLRLMLDSHPNLAIAQETTFGRAVLAHKWIPFWLFGGEWYRRLGWTEEELDVELRRFYATIFGRFAEQQGKQRWGDKSPHHLWMMRDLASVFPEAVFVAAVRHPGAVASSQHHRFGWSWGRAMDRWERGHLELAHRGGDLGDRLAVVRYEDLVLDAEQTLRELLAWLGEPWSPAVTQHHVVHGERGTPTQVEGKTRSTDPVDRARVVKWAESMAPEIRQQLRQTVGPLGAFYGYDVDDPAALDPLPPPSSQRSRVVTGTELAQRKAAFAQVRWKYRPKAAFANQRLKPQRVALVAKSGGKRTRHHGTDAGGASPATDSSGPVRKKERSPAVVKTPLARVARRVFAKLPDVTKAAIKGRLARRDGVARGRPPV